MGRGCVGYQRGPPATGGQAITTRVRPARPRWSSCDVTACSLLLVNFSGALGKFGSALPAKSGTDGMAAQALEPSPGYGIGLDLKDAIG